MVKAADDDIGDNGKVGGINKYSEKLEYSESYFEPKTLSSASSYTNFIVVLAVYFSYYMNKMKKTNSNLFKIFGYFKNSQNIFLTF